MDQSRQKVLPNSKMVVARKCSGKAQIQKELKKFKQAKFSSIELQTLTIGMPKIFNSK